jgi:hypothetical protein
MLALPSGGGGKGTRVIQAGNPEIAQTQDGPVWTLIVNVHPAPATVEMVCVEVV